MIPFHDLDRHPVEPALLGELPLHIMRAHQMIPIAQQNLELTLGLVNPHDERAIGCARILTGWEIIPCTVDPAALDRALRRPGDS